MNCYSKITLKKEPNVSKFNNFHPINIVAMQACSDICKDANTVFKYDEN